MNIKSIRWFDTIAKNDIGTVGGKGANLGEMTQAGFPIPTGFCVTAQAYFKFLEKSGLKPKVIELIESIDEENTSQLEETTSKVRQMILEKPMSNDLKEEIIRAYNKLEEKKLGWLSSTEKAFVAVRSSATAEDLPEASFAGQQDTYLNIVGNSMLLDAVKRCWASLFTARATYYRKKQGFETEQVGISVVVQKMVNSETAGVMFTSSPTGDESKLIIEAAYGLGEVVVSGSVTPDTYVLNKENLAILSKKISKQTWKTTKANGKNIDKPIPPVLQKKQKLSDNSITELGRIGKKIEYHYNHPQDIEWAFEQGKLYIVQSRAITTLALGDKKESKSIETEEEPILEGLSASPGIVSGKIRVIPTAADIEKVKEGDILVTKMTTPDWVPIMRKSTAIITDEGGSTCHAAIVSRELGIPCIVGTENGTKILSSEQLVTVDGYSGKIYNGEVAIERQEEEHQEIIEDEEVDELVEAVEGKEEAEEFEEELDEIKNEEKKEEFLDQEKEKLIEILKTMAIKVKVNVALPDAAERASQTSADGVGLLRAEHMITESGKHPAVFIREGKKRELTDIVKKGIRTVVEKFKGKPVWYRTFDARTDEFRQLQGGKDEPNEDNPMLGWHGIRRSLDQPDMIKAEFMAIKELVREGFDNIGVMLPFIVTVDELKKAKGHARSVGLKPHKDVDFGIMIETPASVWLIDEFIEEGIDFISFGTNDLTQLTMGVDRNNEKIQQLFDSNSKAILRQLEHVIKKCKKANVTTSICGQAASDPEMVKKLIGYGITSVSANIDAVEKIKETVLREEKRILLDKLLNN